MESREVKQKRRVMSVSLPEDTMKKIQKRALELSLEKEKRVTVSSLVEHLITKYVKVKK